jgi:hypothetical protein
MNQPNFHREQSIGRWTSFQVKARGEALYSIVFCWSVENRADVWAGARIWRHELMQHRDMSALV